MGDRLDRVVWQSEKNQRWYWKAQVAGSVVTRCRVRGYGSEAEAESVCNRYANTPSPEQSSKWGVVLACVLVLVAGLVIGYAVGAVGIF